MSRKIFLSILFAFIFIASFGQRLLAEDISEDGSCILLASPVSLDEYKISDYDVFMSLFLGCTYNVNEKITPEEAVYLLGIHLYNCREGESVTKNSDIVIACGKDMLKKKARIESRARLSGKAYSLTCTMVLSYFELKGIIDKGISYVFIDASRKDYAEEFFTSESFKTGMHNNLRLIERVILR